MEAVAKATTSAEQSLSLSSRQAVSAASVESVPTQSVKNGLVIHAESIVPLPISVLQPASLSGLASAHRVINAARAVRAAMVWQPSSLSVLESVHRVINVARLSSVTSIER